MVQISSVLIREIRVYPCPDFKLSGSQFLLNTLGGEKLPPGKVRPVLLPTVARR